MGKLIKFPMHRTEKYVILEELKMQEEEIKMCLDDIEALNDHIVDLTAEYEMLLNRLCELQNIGDLSDKGKYDDGK